MGNSESSQNIPSSSKNSPNFKFLAKLFDDNSTASKDGLKIISKSTFNKLFLDEDTYFPNILHQHFVAMAEDVRNHSTEMQKHAFINGFDTLIKLGVESQEMVEYYLEIFTEGHQNISQTDLVKILFTVHKVYNSHSHATLTPPSQSEGTTDVSMSDESMKDIETLGKCLAYKEITCKNSIATQILHHCPRLFNDIHWWVLKSLSKREGSHQINLQHKKYPKIQLVVDSNSSSSLLGQTALWILSLSIPHDFLRNQTSNDKDGHYFIVQWKRLYNSNEHGLSHNRFKHHCFSYRGPTVMVILLSDELKLVLTMDNEWKESSKCYGDSSTRLYQLRPEFKLLAENNIVLYNERSRGLPVGLTLGTNPAKPLLSLVDGLTQAKVNYLGITQEKCVEKIEVWGCAGLKAETDQKQQQKWQDKHAEQLQKVKLPGRWDDNPDKSLLEMAGITTEHAQR